MPTRYFATLATGRAGSQKLPLNKVAAERAQALQLVRALDPFAHSPSTPGRGPAR